MRLPFVPGADRLEVAPRTSHSGLLIELTAANLLRHVPDFSQVLGQLIAIPVGDVSFDLGLLAFHQNAQRQGFHVGLGQLVGCQLVRKDGLVVIL